ncbi:surfeit locus 1 family protein [Dyella sp. OK004]|uniref:SURF1 family protein n=1 Tax=Dyella sp. OK004 TaxID=1855292 RepID=UPI0008EA15B9|nr:SURF1 family protein [Dyella sp. OK004]SFS19236.1 surfeit locus 1 family protein [Dyella sp. OK004]
MPGLGVAPKASTERGPRGPLALTALALFALVAFAGFVALGTWQVHRLAWKRDLIARVDARVHETAVAAPALSQWPQVTATADEYRHVRLSGVFLHDQQTLVTASTALGSGYWLLTPLRTADGTVVLINRGFVPPDWCGRNATCALGPEGETTVTGLLRMPETKVFLRHNDPAKGRWYARDVQAIAAAHGFTKVTPYFVDADANPADTAGWPRGGLTVISFPNNHLVYLITWYLLALMTAVGAVYVGYHEVRLRRRERGAF